jgi:hypothetical protein
VSRSSPSPGLSAGSDRSSSTALVQQLVKGTVGYDDDYLADYKERLP